MPTTPDFDELREFCSRVGADPNLTQAAGGNVSVKCDETLWIKASGTWLAEALNEEIFVAVDLASLQDQIGRGDFDSAPIKVDDSVLRPSIETLMHACLPHRYVVHLHAIEPLAVLVREEPESELKMALSDANFPWCLIPYAKPGGPLAREIVETLRTEPNASVLFLQNHGVVFAGSSLEEVTTLIAETRTLLREASSIVVTPSHETPCFEAGLPGWHLPLDEDLHELARNPQLFARLTTDWALFPDHVVFLGEIPDIRSSEQLSQEVPPNSPVVFVEGTGILVRTGHKRGLEEQLKGYLAVLMRQDPNRALASLSSTQIAELLDWDAERYRIALQTPSKAN